jgi:predicted pyridoxine 5'-phosphate oxidase superfamily flavin-nucleotide-binding protein
MAYYDIAFTPSVKRFQERLGSRRAYARFDAVEPAGDVAAEPPGTLTSRETQFIAQRDSLYMASVSETGWPYVQHRGGPPGFVKVLSPGTLGFADYRGNRQYVSLGNLAADDRASLFLMDYPNQQRLKIYGRMRSADLAEVAAESFLDADYQAKVERVLLVAVEAFDWNCPQHITPRFTAAELAPALQPMRGRIAELEAEIAALRSATGSRGSR